MGNYLLDSTKEQAIWYGGVKYSIPAFSRRDVNAAGNRFVGRNSCLDLQQSLAIINNWRSSHSFPLNAFYITLLHRAKKVDPKALVSQRLKRLASIEAKLIRFPDMKLTQMQDIGGCRAVVRDLGALARLAALYRLNMAKDPKRRHKWLTPKDYITNPKSDGYRGIHLRYQYCSRAKKHSAYNDLKVEIQLRTVPQHSWATAVEIISTFTGQALKSNIGDESWKRFFKLMSSFIAIREGAPPVHDTPADTKELVAELRQLVTHLQVEAVLTGWGEAIKIISSGQAKRAHTYLLVLDVKQMQITVSRFGKEEAAESQQRYLEVEKENADKPWIQAVLVSVNSVSSLPKAYPNYYLDSSSFLQAVRFAIKDEK